MAADRADRLAAPGERVCRVDGCENRHNTRGYCNQHWREWRERNPDLRVVCYDTAHKQCVRRWGPASTHACIDCGERAVHWSYDNNDPDDLLTRDNLRYSLKNEHYQPRCTTCHRRFDLTWRLSMAAG